MDIGKIIFEKYGDETALFIIVSSLLIGYVIKQIIPMWINLAIEEEKKGNNDKIEKLKSELDIYKQRLEHIHQISQPIYQKLFEKKINIYQELIQISQKYKIKWRNIYNSNPLEDKGEIFYQNIKLYFDEIKEIENIIEGNQLYISLELLEVYKKLIIKIDEFNSDLNELSLYLYNSNMNDIEYSEYEKDKKQKINYEIYKTIKIELLKFSEVLDSDILKIRAKINLD